MGVPRYLAAARVDDLERLLHLADELIGPDKGGQIALLQCGHASVQATEVAALLSRARRPAYPVVVKDRATAQSSSTLGRLSTASAVWVFADDLFETFMTVFATQLAFYLRTSTREGLPVIGVGGGALALGGLMLANRVCKDARYELVCGLGWAPRVLVDGGDRLLSNGPLAERTVRSLPGLLGVDLGARGGIRVNGGRVDSVGHEPIRILGTNYGGDLLRLTLEPGQVVQILPPPFPPFGAGVQRTTTVEVTPKNVKAVAHDHPMIDPNGGRVCPMCHKVHSESRVELAA